MKSTERHKLETNWLAIHLDTWIERVRPYMTTIAGSIVALVAVLMVWTWYANSSGERDREAWDRYNGLMGISPTRNRSIADYSLTLLSKNAEEYSDTPVNEWATVTMADGQTWTASIDILQNRPSAIQALNSAMNKYISVVRSTKDAELKDRAQLGLARVYELQSEPDKAREEYLKVKGNYEPIAKSRAEALADEKAKKAIAWLAKAEVTRNPSAKGGGATGEKPGFEADDIVMPGAGGATPATGGLPADLMKELNLNDLLPGAGDTPNRYEPTPGAGDGKTGAGDGKAPVDEKAKTQDQKTPADAKSDAGAKDSGSKSPAPSGGK